jgi:hypothetical protein
MADIPSVGGALLLTLAFHELGHGIAAATERVKTEGVGVFVAFVVPGAFVRLEEGLLPQLPTRAQLKVYCAGAWHNLILAAFCVAATAGMPLALFPLYHRSALGLPLDLPQHSPFYGRTGRPDEVLLALDSIPMLSSRSLTHAVMQISERASLASPLVHFGIDAPNISNKEELVQAFGVCVDPKHIQQVAARDTSSNLQCFVFDDTATHQYSRQCVRPSLLIMEARRVAESLSSRSSSLMEISCEGTLDCMQQDHTSLWHSSSLQCFRPIVDPGESFVIVHLASSVSMAWRGVAVRDGLGPALRLAPLGVRPTIAAWILSLGGKAFLIFLVRFPARLLYFVKTLRDVSLSIALLNILPIYWLDGSLAAVQYIRMFLLSATPKPPMTSRSTEAHRRSRSFNAPDDDAVAQVLRNQYHDWNALHTRQKRLTRMFLGGGTALVAINVLFGSISVIMH